MPTSVVDLALLVIYGFLFGLGFHWSEILLRRVGR